MNPRRHCLSLTAALILVGWLGLISPLARSAPSVTVSLRVEPFTSHDVSGGDDVRHLKRLAGGVGWDFSPNDAIAARLEEIGIRTIRSINVEPEDGHFTSGGDYVITDAGRLNSHLETCRRIGAAPHIILSLKEPKGMRPPGNQNSRWSAEEERRYRAYCRSVFDYVLREKGFREARFEVGNEPDISTGFFKAPKTAEKGSKALYDAYLALYRQVSQAAREYEADRSHPKVTLGGPALAWAFTYRHGDFNWITRFLRDTREKRLKLDFIGVHFYGNTSSLRGEFPSPYPSFQAMLETLKDARRRYHPDVPIWITEWGPSYHTENTPESYVNANHIGAAWGMEFLNILLENGVEGALYLATTDFPARKGDDWVNVWGWPALFANPLAVGTALPKPPFHVFDMISRLQGQRVRVRRSGAQSVEGFASADRGRRALTLLLWNYNARIPEGGAAIERAPSAMVEVEIRDADRLFGSDRVLQVLQPLSATESNVFQAWRQGKPLRASAELKTLERTVRLEGSTLRFRVAMPPSSLAFLTLTPD